MCFTGKKFRAKFSKDENLENGLQVEIIAVKGTMVVINTGTSIFQVNASKLRRPLNTVDLEEPPDSCERTGARVLWLVFVKCKGASRRTRHVDTKIYFMQAWAMEPGSTHLEGAW